MLLIQPHRGSLRPPSVLAAQPAAFKGWTSHDLPTAPILCSTCRLCMRHHRRGSWFQDPHACSPSSAVHQAMLVGACTWWPVQQNALRLSHAQALEQLRVLDGQLDHLHTRPSCESQAETFRRCLDAGRQVKGTCSSGAGCNLYLQCLMSATTALLAAATAPLRAGWDSR